MSETIAHQDSRSQLERLLFRVQFALIAFLAVHSTLTQESEPDGRMELLLALVWAVTAVAYCATACRRLGLPLPTNSLWLLFILWPVAVPLCLMWAHGIRKWWKVPLGLLSMLAVGIAGVAVGALIDVVRR